MDGAHSVWDRPPHEKAEFERALNLVRLNNAGVRLHATSEDWLIAYIDRASISTVDRLMSYVKS